MDYISFREHFLENLKVMSRTANSILDLSSSEKKSESMATRDADIAKKHLDENIEKALTLIYENRYKRFSSEEELENFILQIAECTNAGIVKPDKLFRSGTDSIKFAYARIENLKELWAWFCGALFHMLSTPEKDPVEVAAFAEYFINRRGHFFSDGCGKIAMLISSFILIRNDMRIPEYRSREEYYSVAEPKTRPTPEQPMEEDLFRTFLKYYKSLFKSYFLKRNIDKETKNKGIHASISGSITAELVPYFRSQIKSLYAENPDEDIILGAKELEFLSTAAAEEIRSLSETHRNILFDELNQLCFVSLHLAGLDDHVLRHSKIPEIEVSDCERIGGGANGIVYRYENDKIAKVFISNPDVDEILMESKLLKKLFWLNIPCPISFGIALCDGKLALIYEMMDAVSLKAIIKENRSNIAKYMPEYIALVRKMHMIQGEDLDSFPRQVFKKEVLMKADILDAVIGESYIGKTRKIIESIQEPETLLHGDIQPSNVMFGKDGAYFIDFDTISTGYPILEIGNLRRSMICDFEFGEYKDNPFLGISAETSMKFWNTFIDMYYKGVDKTVLQEKLRLAEIISIVLYLAKLKKRNNIGAAFEKGLQRLRNLIDMWNYYE